MVGVVGTGSNNQPALLKRLRLNLWTPLPLPIGPCRPLPSVRLCISITSWNPTKLFQLPPDVLKGWMEAIMTSDYFWYQPSADWILSLRDCVVGLQQWALKVYQMGGCWASTSGKVHKISINFVDNSPIPWVNLLWQTALFNRSIQCPGNIRQ